MTNPSSSDSCSSCGSTEPFDRDLNTETLYCVSCGTFQEFDRYEAQLGGLNGPTGNYVNIGHTGLGNDYSYRERKIANANILIDEIVSKLGLSDFRLNEVKDMIRKITEGEFGDGNWFRVLIAACCYVVMRSDGKAIPISEVSESVGCDVYEMGRMVSRVVEHLELKLPEFDIVGAFERAVGVVSGFRKLSEGQVDVMRKQGVFILQCAVKWFLTTGRQPMPMVVAVIMFVAKLNKVGLKIDVVAKELKTNVQTCRKRFKELLETLVKVAQALPWGKDVTVKNIMSNAHFVIQYMEMKAMAKPEGIRSFLEGMRLDMGELVNECLKKETYELYELHEDYDSKYYEVGDRNGVKMLSAPVNEETKIPHESLATIYKNFLKNVADGKSTRSGNGLKRKRDYNTMDSTDWWTGESELSGKLTFDDTLDFDIGWDDALPPSYVTGCEAIEKRREKIKAAKLRIESIRNPTNSVISNESLELCNPDVIHTAGSSLRSADGKCDWEDLIIESLLLHGVSEEEIEKGHYSTLQELYTNNPIDLKK